MKRVLRYIGFVVLGLSLVLSGLFLAPFLTSNNNNDTDVKIQLQRTPSVAATLPGDQLDAVHTELRDQYEGQAAQQAAASDTRDSFQADIRPLQPVDNNAMQVTPRGQWQAPAAKQEQQPEPPSLNENRIQRRVGAYQELMAAWKPDGHHVVPFDNSELVAAQEQAASDAIAAASLPAPLQLIGDIHYGKLIVGINSDYQIPAQIEVLNGPAQGALIKATFEQAVDDQLVIKLESMQLNNISYSVEGYAIDLDSGSYGISTDVNRRTLSRWSAVLASAVLSAGSGVHLELA